MSMGERLFESDCVSRIKVKAHLKMRIHDAAAVEVWLGEMNNTQFCASGDIHECLLIFDLSVCAMLVRLQSPCLVKFGMQLLQALFSKGIELIVVLFKGGNQGVLVRIVIPCRAIDDRRNLWVQSSHVRKCCTMAG
jgi:hypothetical protein